MWLNHSNVVKGRCGRVLDARVRCAICDDDYAFLKGFYARVEGWFAAQNIPCECRVFLTPSELLMASVDGFDILFLNVDMGYWDGINIARNIRRAGGGPLIIFVSAFVQFAPHGYGVGAFRFLMKDDLDATFPQAMEDAMEAIGAPGRTLLVQSRKEEYEVPLAGILYAESHKRVLTYHLEGFEPPTLSSYGKLSELEETLRDKGFLRIHKSFLVNMRHVEDIRNYLVCLDDGTELQASRQNYREIKDTYEAWRKTEEMR